MYFLTRLSSLLVFIIALLNFVGYLNSAFPTIDKKHYLVAQSYTVAKTLFEEGRNYYNSLKERSLVAFDYFLDLAAVMNEEMSKELRTAVIKFYKVKYFHDFSNYAISLEDIVDIVEHCLADPVEKLEQVREQFKSVIRNFEDPRSFGVVDKCANELPDEVAAAHCILHQAVLFNETMSGSLVTIVEIKTRQHAQDMNASITSVKSCLTDFVPRFYEQILVDAYTPNCGFLKVFNASLTDLMTNKWRSNTSYFDKKWRPVVKLLRDKNKNQYEDDSLFFNDINKIVNRNN